MRCYQAVIKIFNQCSVCVCALGGQGDYFWGWDIFLKTGRYFGDAKNFIDIVSVIYRYRYINRFIYTAIYIAIYRYLCRFCFLDIHCDNSTFDGGRVPDVGGGSFYGGINGRKSCECNCLPLPMSTLLLSPACDYNIVN